MTDSEIARLERAIERTADRTAAACSKLSASSVRPRAASAPPFSCHRKLITRPGSMPGAEAIRRSVMSNANAGLPCASASSARLAQQ